MIEQMISVPLIDWNRLVEASQKYENNPDAKILVVASAAMKLINVHNAPTCDLCGQKLFKLHYGGDYEIHRNGKRECDNDV